MGKRYSRMYAHVNRFAANEISAKKKPSAPSSPRSWPRRSMSTCVPHNNNNNTNRIIWFLQSAMRA